MGLDKLSVLLWDFDGVLMDSMPVRDMGFELVLENYPAEQVQQLMVFHRANGGLSRYVKFRYFFEQIRNEPVSEERVNELAGLFSEIMRKRLSDTSLLIGETIDFVKANSEKLPMYIVSGSDQAELRFLCSQMEIARYFKMILGSPTPKTELVKTVLANAGAPADRCLLVGDSINDYHAAVANGLHFMAYNNHSIEDKTTFSLSFKG